MARVPGAFSRQYLLVCNEILCGFAFIFCYMKDLKRHVHKLRFSTMNNFYCFIKNILKMKLAALTFAQLWVCGGEYIRNPVWGYLWSCFGSC